MDAESIVKAMEEAGLRAYKHGVGSLGLEVDVSGELEAWSRFRGVPMEEVEKAMGDEYDALTDPAKFTVVRKYWIGVMRRLRGGD